MEDSTLKELVEHLNTIDENIDPSEDFMDEDTESLFERKAEDLGMDAMTLKTMTSELKFRSPFKKRRKGAKVMDGVVGVEVFDSPQFRYPSLPPFMEFLHETASTLARHTDDRLSTMMLPDPLPHEYGTMTSALEIRIGGSKVKNYKNDNQTVLVYHVADTVRSAEQTTTERQDLLPSGTNFFLFDLKEEQSILLDNILKGENGGFIPMEILNTRLDVDSLKILAPSDVLQNMYVAGTSNTRPVVMYFPAKNLSKDTIFRPQDTLDNGGGVFLVFSNTRLRFVGYLKIPEYSGSARRLQPLTSQAVERSIVREGLIEQRVGDQLSISTKSVKVGEDIDMDREPLQISGKTLEDIPVGRILSVFGSVSMNANVVSRLDAVSMSMNVWVVHSMMRSNFPYLEESPLRQPKRIFLSIMGKIMNNALEATSKRLNGNQSTKLAKFAYAVIALLRIQLHKWRARMRRAVLDKGVYSDMPSYLEPYAYSFDDCVPLNVLVNAKEYSPITFAPDYAFSDLPGLMSLPAYAEEKEIDGSNIPDKYWLFAADRTVSRFMHLFFRTKQFHELRNACLWLSGAFAIVARAALINAGNINSAKMNEIHIKITMNQDASVVGVRKVLDDITKLSI